MIAASSGEFFEIISSNRISCLFHSSGNRIFILELVNVGRVERFVIKHRYIVDGAQQKPKLPADEFYTIDWNVNLVKGENMLAFAGEFGNIHVVWTLRAPQSFVLSREAVMSVTEMHVNEVKFHPHQCNLLLSASKDTTCRY